MCALAWNGCFPWDQRSRGWGAYKALCAAHRQPVNSPRALPGSISLYRTWTKHLLSWGTQFRPQSVVTHTPSPNAAACLLVQVGQLLGQRVRQAGVRVAVHHQRAARLQRRQHGLPDKDGVYRRVWLSKFSPHWSGPATVHGPWTRGLAVWVLECVVRSLGALHSRCQEPVVLHPTRVPRPHAPSLPRTASPIGWQRTAGAQPRRPAARRFSSSRQSSAQWRLCGRGSATARH